MVQELLIVLEKVVIDRKARDELIWKPNIKGRFSVKSFCPEIEARKIGHNVQSFPFVWKGFAPLKVEVFI